MFWSFKYVARLAKAFKVIVTKAGKDNKEALPGQEHYCGVFASVRFEV